MPVASQIYLGRADAIAIDVDGERVVDLDDALRAAARDATEITILGGFYDATWLETLAAKLPRHRRRDCRVRIAVGVDATVLLPRIWQDMRRVRTELERLGYHEPQVAIVGRSPVHFHTKLFRFLKTTRPSWFVGSANPGSERHELMVRIDGRHEGLSSYVDAVFAVAQTVTGPPPRRQRPANVREFLLDGTLCHKPPQQQLFTFEAYRLNEADRRRIDANLGRGSGVAHSAPRTEGFGFGLRSSLGLANESRGKVSDKPARAQFRSLGIDTLFGLWMPRPFAAIAERMVARRQRDTALRLAAIGDRLSTANGTDAARTGFRNYVQTMDQFLIKLGLEPCPVRNRDAAFERFLVSRTKGLADPAFVKRHARVMTIAPMFDVWQDPVAASGFVSSFFDDLAFRAATTTARRPRIVRSLLDGLGDDAEWQTAEELRVTFEQRLIDEPWSDDEWQS